jgi:hypothetical protein
MFFLSTIRLPPQDHQGIGICFKDCLRTSSINHKSLTDNRCRVLSSEELRLFVAFDLPPSTGTTAFEVRDSRAAIFNALLRAHLAPAAHTQGKILNSPLIDAAPMRQRPVSRHLRAGQLWQRVQWVSNELARGGASEGRHHLRALHAHGPVCLIRLRHRVPVDDRLSPAGQNRRVHLKRLDSGAASPSPGTPYRTANCDLQALLVVPRLCEEA